MWANPQDDRLQTRSTWTLYLRIISTLQHNGVGWRERGSRCGNERFLCKVKEGKDLRGGVLLYAAQENLQPDAEIAKKRRFRTRTS